MKNINATVISNVVQPAFKYAVKGLVAGFICTCCNTYADTSTIIDSIEIEKQTMTTAVGIYKEIQLDFEAANALQQELAELMRNNAPAAEIALKGNQMIQKKLSGITVAISQVDTLVDSIQKVKGLLDELIS